MREKEVRGLMEAYSQVYTPQELTEEQVWEEVETWVNSLLEEGYDLSDYTWEEMYESYIEEVKDLNLTKGISKDAQAQLRQRRANIEARGGTLGQIGRVLTRGFGSGEQISKLDAEDKADRRREQTALNRSSNPTTTAATPTPKFADLRGSNTPGSNTPATKTNTPTTPKPSATTAAKPAAPAAKQTGDKTKDMATFAKANPKLAAAAAEKARIRGTSQSDNPLMKGMPGKRPMTPSVQSPTLAKDLGKGSGNQSLLDNPNASKAAPPKAAPTTAPKPTATPARNGFGVSAAPIAAKASVATTTATPTPAAAKPATPKPSLQDTIKKNRGITSSFDLFDLVKGHLLDEGYAESEDAAMVIMVNMSEEWRESILESYGVELELDESQYARENPEKYERSSESREGRRRRSGINDPNTGINSPAFQAFMAQQMGGKKKKD
jgi:hypothetical protein